jgi:PBP1b-binding outer membrane lipoprotein LpoB
LFSSLILVSYVLMTKTTRVLLLVLILVLLLAGARWYLAPKNPDPSNIAQVLTAQQPTSLPTPPTGEAQQEVIVPDTVIASIQPSDGAQLIPVE